MINMQVRPQQQQQAGMTPLLGREKTSGAEQSNSISPTKKSRESDTRSDIENTEAKVVVEQSNEEAKENKTSRSQKLKQTARARTQAKMTKMLMTSKRNLNRIDTFYYEKPKAKKNLNSEGQFNSEDEANEGSFIEASQDSRKEAARTPLVFKKRSRRDKTYFLANTVQIQCDMDDTNSESEPGETETETEEEEYYEIPPKSPSVISEEEPKPKRDPNVIHLTENDAIIKIIFQKRDSSRKSKQITLFEKQRLLLKSLYDIRRSRINNCNVSHLYFGTI